MTLKWRDYPGNPVIRGRPSLATADRRALTKDSGRSRDRPEVARTLHAAPDRDVATRPLSFPRNARGASVRAGRLSPPEADAWMEHPSSATLLLWAFPEPLAG